MKKIGFLVQRDWLTLHFGVRNLFTALASLYGEKYHVDFIAHSNQDGEPHWYICDPVAGQERKTLRIELNKTADISTFSQRKYQKFIFNQGKNKKDQGLFALPLAHFRTIGASLEPEKYDLLVITNPWLVDFDCRLPARKVVGIVHDLIPNQYSLTKPTADYSFAHAHHRGYRYYMKHCDNIVADSKVSAETFNEYYRTGRCVFLPPFPPYAFRRASYQGEPKENAMLLAAPFDPRKGISLMPELINGSVDILETLYIYGEPRCSEVMFDEFFSKLKVKKLVYYPYIDSQELIGLYNRCRALLFPSLEEGLGLPIIEAQICEAIFVVSWENLCFVLNICDVIRRIN